MLSFNGGIDYVRVPDSPSLDFTTAITMETWVKFNSIDTRYETLVNKMNMATEHYSSYHMERNRIAVPGESWLPWMGTLSSSVLTTAGTSTVLSTTLPEAGKWYHVASTYDGNMHSLYINGRLETSSTFSGTILVSDEPLLFGRWAWPGYPSPLSGTLDEVALHNHALTAEEIWQRYRTHINAAPVGPGSGCVDRARDCREHYAGRHGFRQ